MKTSTWTRLKKDCPARNYKECSVKDEYYSDCKCKLQKECPLIYWLEAVVKESARKDYL